MYTGSLIDELFATVQRAEARAEEHARLAGEPAELERWYTQAHQAQAHQAQAPQLQPRIEQNLLGVA